MGPQPPSVDGLMDQASRALTATDYLECEWLCEQALAMARDEGDYERLSRIVLPLQEARRFKRQAALDAGVHVFHEYLKTPEEIMADIEAGCVLLTSPLYTNEDALAVRALARERGLFVEVLLLDQDEIRSMFNWAGERAGDAMLAYALNEPDPIKRVDLILEHLPAVGDHEKAHQRLADAAREAAKQ